MNKIRETISDFRIQFDKFCEYVPILSTINGAINLIQKRVFEKKETPTAYQNHIKAKTKDECIKSMKPFSKAFSKIEKMIKERKNPVSTAKASVNDSASSSNDSASSSTESPPVDTPPLATPPQVSGKDKYHPIFQIYYKNNRPINITRSNMEYLPEWLASLENVRQLTLRFDIEPSPELIAQLLEMNSLTEIVVEINDELAKIALPREIAVKCAYDPEIGEKITILNLSKQFDANPKTLSQLWQEPLLPVSQSKDGKATINSPVHLNFSEPQRHITQLTISNPKESVNFLKLMETFPNLEILTIESDHSIRLPEAVFPNVELNVNEEKTSIGWTPLADLKKAHTENFLEANKNNPLALKAFLRDFHQLYNAGFDKTAFIRKYGVKNLDFGQVFQFFASVDPSQLSNIDNFDLPSFVLQNVGNLVLKKMGHVFALNNTLHFSAQKVEEFRHLPDFSEGSVKLEGSYKDDMFVQVVYSAEQFLDSPLAGDRFTSDEKKRMNRALREGLEHHYTPQTKDQVIDRCLESYQAGRPVVIPTGWRGHAISVVIDGDHLVITNRGDRAHANANSRVYKINDPASINKETLAKILVDDDRTEKGGVVRKQFFSEGIEQALGLTKVFEIKKKDQTVGNCGYTNNKGAFQALMFLQEYRKNQEAGYKAAQNTTKSLYRKWSLQDRCEALNEFEQFLKVVPHTFFKPEDIQKLVQDMRDKLKDQIEKFGRDLSLKSLALETQATLNRVKVLAGFT